VDELIDSFTFYTLTGAPVSRNFAMTRCGLISHSRDDLKVALPDGRQPVTAHLGAFSSIAWRAQNALMERGCQLTTRSDRTRMVAWQQQMIAAFPLTSDEAKRPAAQR
jgi:hypothetical protein